MFIASGRSDWRSANVVWFRLQRKGRYFAIKGVTILTLQSEGTPHMTTWRLKTYMAAVLERW